MNEEQRPDSIENPEEAMTSAADSPMVLASELLPNGLPILPIRPRPSFPGILTPIALTGKEPVAVVKRALDTPSQALGLVLVVDPEAPDSPANLHQVGVVGKIIKVLHSEAEEIHFVLNCVERFRIEELSETPQGLFARVNYHRSPEYSDNQELKAYSLAILTT
ncbi:MAG: LON peptidase substrate-binding domain-containing protein, partial [Desulfuromonadales bacterium]|nr:LON peptidase substrate-binding domain-containing protein [Desulfuromonadales bacterium]